MADLIRLVEDKDMADCVRLSKLMYNDFLTRYGIPMVDKDLYETVQRFVKSKQILICEREGSVRGLAAWVVTPHPANGEVKIFQEVVWAVDSDNPYDAMELLRALEKQATSMAVDIIVLANLSEMNDERLKRIYKKKGYEYLESHFSKKRR